MSKHFWGWVLIIIVALTLLIGLLYRKMVDISRPFPTIERSAVPDSTESGKPLYYFGVISRFPPTLIYQGYQPIMDYLNTHIPYHFELKLSKSYKQTVNQLSSGKVVAAFLGSFLFAKEGKAHHLHCILKPLNVQGKPYLHADLITSRSSAIHTIKDLRGKRVALPSPLSFSANWFVFKALLRNNLKPSEFTALQNFAHHHTVIYEVLKRHFDAGVVKDRVARDFLNRGIRVVQQSVAIPSSPIVVSEKSPKAVVLAIRRALLSIDLNRAEDRRIVSYWDAEFAHGFVPANDRDYDILMPLVKVAGSR